MSTFDLVDLFITSIREYWECKAWWGTSYVTWKAFLSKRCFQLGCERFLENYRTGWLQTFHVYSIHVCRRRILWKIENSRNGAKWKFFLPERNNLSPGGKISNFKFSRNPMYMYWRYVRSLRLISKILHADIENNIGFGEERVLHTYTHERMFSISIITIAKRYCRENFCSM